MSNRASGEGDRDRRDSHPVTDRPTTAWTAQQLREAFPFGSAPRYLLRDRDHAFADGSTTANATKIPSGRHGAQSPWQNAHVERFIGSVRRECLDHVLVRSKTGLRRTLHANIAYFLRSRTTSREHRRAGAASACLPGSTNAVPQVDAFFAASAERRGAILYRSPATCPPKPGHARFTHTQEVVLAPKPRDSVDSRLGVSLVTRTLSDRRQLRQPTVRSTP